MYLAASSAASCLLRHLVPSVGEAGLGSALPLIFACCLCWASRQVVSTAVVACATMPPKLLRNLDLTGRYEAHKGHHCGRSVMS